ncbi:MAG TPA: stage II sporulation protein P [Peptococcaceae bacterium]|nr:MAG: Stage II sporulation protein P [Clostridia bacterium 41_269]HBT20519.1 stage II sporulation protein P [Peptococcaceae bacterium]
MKNNRTYRLLTVIVFIFILGLLVFCEKGEFKTAFSINLTGEVNWGVECKPGTYYTIYDQKGNVIEKTSRMVNVGDEFIDEDNNRYSVIKVKGYKAEAELLGREEIVWEVNGQGETDVLGGDFHIPVQRVGVNNLVAVYHTHSDESYIPTDGTQSIPGSGGIFKVGEIFAEKLRSLGMEVIHDRRSHEPHDANAYRRSRRTSTRLLQKNPAAIIDIHRDGVPDPDFYIDNVAGQEVSKIRLVIGRQNPNMQANFDFAKRLKGYLDEKYPGLVKGIYLAKGNYNQDLSPRSILVEAGTHTISRERAQRGIALFAEALPPVLGVSPSPTPFKQEPAGTRGDLAAALFVILSIIIGSAIYLVISTGSIEGAVRKLKQFITVEWTNFFGKRWRK